jgi:hypothetical protein
MPNYDDPNDPAWDTPDATVHTGESLARLGDEVFGADEGLSLNERIDRGIEAMSTKGYAVDRSGPVAQTMDDAQVVVYSFVRRDSGLR